MKDAVGFPYQSLRITGEMGEQLCKARPRRKRRLEEDQRKGRFGHHAAKGKEVGTKKPSSSRPQQRPSWLPYVGISSSPAASPGTAQGQLKIPVGRRRRCRGRAPTLQAIKHSFLGSSWATQEAASNQTSPVCGTNGSTRGPGRRGQQRQEPSPGNHSIFLRMSFLRDGETETQRSEAVTGQRSKKDSFDDQPGSHLGPKVTLRKNPQAEKNTVVQKNLLSGDNGAPTPVLNFLPPTFF
ncbi:uncharacterized protein LOC128626332 [Artibeus jamaicensis]|uniref:uncharacterized protein LOC128626332 n=1 Tax=Artibeus jamaicensis TaxID=9417 RepID=UPI00235B1A69|nr:uncharacterized protein LOC128626332 [Artibeus jamaicensis]